MPTSSGACPVGAFPAHLRSAVREVFQAVLKIAYAESQAAARDWRALEDGLRTLYELPTDPVAGRPPDCPAARDDLASGRRYAKRAEWRDACLEVRRLLATEFSVRPASREDGALLDLLELSYSTLGPIRFSVIADECTDAMRDALLRLGFAHDTGASREDVELEVTAGYYSHLRGGAGISVFKPMYLGSSGRPPLNKGFVSYIESEANGRRCMHLSGPEKDLLATLRNVLEDHAFVDAVWGSSLNDLMDALKTWRREKWRLEDHSSPKGTIRYRG